MANGKTVQNTFFPESPDEDEHENSFFGVNSQFFEMDCLETVPFDDEVGVDYESDYTV